MKKKRKLDQTDKKIIDILRVNGRISNVDLSRKLELAPSATLERTRRLEKDGVIEGYFAQINPQSINKSMCVFALVSVSSTNWSDDTKNALESIEDVTEVYEVMGEGSFLLKIQTENTETLHEVLKNQIGSMAEVTSTKSTMVLSSLTNLS